LISCDRCGEKVETPVLARFYARGGVQTYYACPHCLTRIRKANEKKEKAKRSLPPRMRAKSMCVEVLWKPGPKVKYHNPDAWMSYLRS